MAYGKDTEQDQLSESLNDLFTSVSAMIKGELQGTNLVLELLEKMNIRVAEEYKGYSDVASGLRVFVEQLKSKSSAFDSYVQHLDAIEQHVSEFEAVVSMLNNYVSMLESKMKSVYQIPPA
ncbi:biogenesis of lysosome-related organelles complex 1 subunit 2 [Orobanche minor]